MSLGGCRGSRLPGLAGRPQGSPVPEHASGMTALVSLYGRPLRSPCWRLLCWRLLCWRSLCRRSLWEYSQYGNQQRSRFIEGKVLLVFFRVLSFPYHDDRVAGYVDTKVVKVAIGIGPDTTLNDDTVGRDQVIACTVKWVTEHYRSFRAGTFSILLLRKCKYLY